MGTLPKRPSKGDGGASRDRTGDLYNAIVALSQLSYGPNTLRRATGSQSRDGCLMGQPELAKALPS
jgi:hypothetical protein